MLILNQLDNFSSSLFIKWCIFSNRADFFLFSYHKKDANLNLSYHISHVVTREERGSPSPFFFFLDTICQSTFCRLPVAFSIKLVFDRMNEVHPLISTWLPIWDLTYLCLLLQLSVCTQILRKGKFLNFYSSYTFIVYSKGLSINNVSVRGGRGGSSKY